MPAGKRQRQAGIAFALLAIVATAHAEYKDDYAHGVKAYSDGDYAKARELVGKALEEHAEPAVRFNPYGKVYMPYLPQHYVGLAAFKLGDCGTALGQWGSAANKQIVAQMSDIGSEEQRDIAICEQKGFAKKEEKSTTQQIVNMETPTTKGTLAENAPAKPPSPPTRPVESPPTKPPVPPIERPVTEKPVVAVKNAPPELLVQAFENYLLGHYKEVAAINPDTYADTRARFQAYLVRAASKYTLARISADAEMLKGAHLDAHAAHALDAHTEPDETLFSPGFRAFYKDSN